MIKKKPQGKKKSNKDRFVWKKEQVVVTKKPDGKK